MYKECLSEYIQSQIKTPEAPDHICSDNSSEFIGKSVRDCLERLGVKTLFIEPGSPWENGYI
jgi:transposase InsO family protein